MIVKKIPNPKKSATKRARIAGLGNYIAQPQQKNGNEKCIHFEARNFLTSNLDAQLAEMIALASESRSADPVDHWVLSWRADERPTVEQAREAAETFISHCGLRGHQFMWGLHDDTDNIHCHIQVNRVHPDTQKVVKINKGFDKEAGQQVGALIEHIQGWAPEKGSRYQIVNGKPALRDKKNRALEPSTAVRAMEQQTGEKSAQRIGIEEAAPLIETALTWRELHDKLAAAGMRYERKGSGAIVFIGNVAVKASDVSRSASLSAIQKRLGAYQPSKEIHQDDYYHHTPQPYPAALREKSTNGMRILSECRMAIVSEKQQTQRAGVLHIDARADRHRADGLRRDARSGAAEREHAGRNGDSSADSRDQRLRTSEEREAGTKRKKCIPLRGDQPGWQEYQAIKTERRAAKDIAVTEQQKKQEAARNALFEKHTAERDEVFKERWVGRGELRNAMRSELAVRQAAERLELREQQQSERAALHTQYPAMPLYKKWLEDPQIVFVVGQRPTQIDQDKQRLSEILRSFKSSHSLISGTTFHFDGQAIFRDEGKLLRIIDHKKQNADSIAAALVVAQGKYGSKLTLTGPDDFKRRAVAAAVEYGLSVKFSDPALEELRKQLSEQKRQAERAARQVTQQLTPSPIQSAPQARLKPAPVAQDGLGEEDAIKTAQKALIAKWRPIREADKADLQYGKVEDVADGLAIVHLGRGDYAWAALPLGVKPEIGKHLRHEAGQGTGQGK